MDRSAQLHLLRHAKSSWGDSSLRDHDRPLAARGRRATTLLRRHFDAVALCVDLVLCSPAQRTRETWERVRKGLTKAPDVRFVPDVYEATVDTLLGLIRAVDPTVTALMIIGHNPGLEELTAVLADGLEKPSAARLPRDFPTGGFATFTVRSDWADLDRGGVSLESFVRPRDLSVH
jgi:phosphohistidine phosphatase